MDKSLENFKQNPEAQFLVLVIKQHKKRSIRMTYSHFKLFQYYIIRINFRADKISRKFAQRRPNARNFIRELRA